MPEDKSGLAAVFAEIHYRDIATAIGWLGRAFGLTERYAVTDDQGRIVHAELGWGSGLVMLGVADAQDAPVTVAPGSAVLYVVVDDPDEHYGNAVAAGAEIVLPLRDEHFGSRTYTARDLEGNLWTFGTYVPSGCSPVTT